MTIVCVDDIHGYCVLNSGKVWIQICTLWLWSVSNFNLRFMTWSCKELFSSSGAWLASWRRCSSPHSFLLLKDLCFSLCFSPWPSQPVSKTSPLKFLMLFLLVEIFIQLRLKWYMRWEVNAYVMYGEKCLIIFLLEIAYYWWFKRSAHCWGQVSCFHVFFMPVTWQLSVKIKPCSSPY